MPRSRHRATLKPPECMLSQTTPGSRYLLLAVSPGFIPPVMAHPDWTIADGWICCLKTCGISQKKNAPPSSCPQSRLLIQPEGYCLPAKLLVPDLSRPNLWAITDSGTIRCSCRRVTARHLVNY